ncbi:MAG: zinc-ribbon domain-containing protein [Christensenellales bacterium]
MYCRNCRAQIPDESKICPECGTEQIVTVRIEQPQKEVDARIRGLPCCAFSFR